MYILLSGAETIVPNQLSPKWPHQIVPNRCSKSGIVRNFHYLEPSLSIQDGSRILKLNIMMTLWLYFLRTKFINLFFTFSREKQEQVSHLQLFIPLCGIPKTPPSSSKKKQDVILESSDFIGNIRMWHFIYTVYLNFLVWNFFHSLFKKLYI